MVVGERSSVLTKQSFRKPGLFGPVWLTLVIVLFGGQSSFAQSALTKVAVIDFINNTNQPSFGWLSGSIPEAIDKSMGKIFVYQGLSKEETNTIAQDIGYQGAGYTTNELSEIAAELDANIIIYGSFTPVQDGSHILIKARLYSEADDKVIAEVSEKSPTDGRLFKANEAVAVKIVDLIRQIAGGGPATKKGSPPSAAAGDGSGKIALQTQTSLWRQIFPGLGMYSAGLHSMLPGSGGDHYLGTGLGLRLDAVHGVLWRQLQLQTSLGFVQAEEKLTGEDAAILQFGVGIGYTFRLLRWYRLRPWIGTGYHANIQANGFGVLVGELGVTNYFFFSRRAGMSVTASNIFYNDDSLPIIFDSVTGGVFYRY